MSASKSTSVSSSLAASQADTLVTQNDPTQRFTATGRPMQAIEPSGLANMPGGIGLTPQAPQFLPVKFNDDSIIPVPVLVAAAAAEGAASGEQQKRGFMDKMKGLLSAREKEGRLRVVYMPRGDYLKYFAKDDDSNYVGTEPQRSYTDEELDRMFARYVPAPSARPKEPLFDKMLSGLVGAG